MESLQTNAPQPSQLTYRNNMLKITEPTYIEMNGSGELKYVSASKQEGNRLKVKHLIVIQGAGTNSRIQEFQNNGFTISNPITLGERKAAVMNELKARYYPTEGEVTFGATTVSVTSELVTLREQVAYQNNELNRIRTELDTLTSQPQLTQLVTQLNKINQSINEDTVALSQNLNSLKTDYIEPFGLSLSPILDDSKLVVKLSRYEDSNNISQIKTKQYSLVEGTYGINICIEKVNKLISSLNKLIEQSNVLGLERIDLLPLVRYACFNIRFDQHMNFVNTIKNSSKAVCTAIQAFLDNNQNKAAFTRISGNIAKLREIQS